MKRTAVMSALFLGALSLAACSSDSSTTATSTTAAPASTVAEDTTTSALAAVGGTVPAASAPTVPSTTTPTVVLMPLTGQPVADPAVAARVALVVKIDNHDDARPQSGLNLADIVYEENVEALTRFAAIYQTLLPDPVGPIRSGRTQDVLLFSSLNRPIFAWSGGNPNVTRAINSSDFVVANVQIGAAQAAGQAFRAKDRKSPHNLYANGSGLETLAPAGATPPPQQFRYLAAGAQPAGVPSTGVAIAMDSVKVRWDWDPPSNSYLRSQDGAPHEDRDNGQVNAANVVVLTVDYQPSPADGRSPEAQTIGTGDVAVFTAGHIVTGTWTRTDRLRPFTLTDASGAPILLTPGRTWVELARSGVTAPFGS